MYVPSDDRDAPAWYGKLASLGDFATRRLPQDTARVLDAWLSQGVDASRAQLGDARWFNLYLTSPLWRFAWAPGVFDASSWWFGLMMPSVDSVGRYFPLVVLQAREHPPAGRDALGQLEAWYAAIARAALRTLQPGSSLEQFEADLIALAATAPLPASPPAAPWTAAQWTERTRHEMEAGTTLAQCFEQLTVAESLRRLRGCSLWWSLRPGEQASSLSIAVGLPARESFVQLLEGVW
ncbi:MAG TPA: type VI secretion system-associated protein TagF [Burkholderiaceae bacterium]